MSEIRSVKEILKYSASAGFPMGVYLSVISVCMMASLHWDVLSTVALLMICTVPCILWRILSPLARDAGENVKAGSLWLAGIYAFLFGSLILGLITAVYMILVEPKFVSLYIQKYLDTVKALPNPEMFSEQTQILQQMIDRKLLPGTMDFVSTLIWATGFFGSILSGIVALIMARYYKLRAPRSIAKTN